MLIMIIPIGHYITLNKVNDSELVGKCEKLSECERELRRQTKQ